MWTLDIAHGDVPRQHHPIARPSLLALLLHLQPQGRAHDADGRSATGAAA
jgi:hypothetical protein